MSEKSTPHYFNSPTGESLAHKKPAQERHLKSRREINDLGQIDSPINTGQEILIPRSW